MVEPRIKVGPCKVRAIRSGEIFDGRVFCVDNKGEHPVVALVEYSVSQRLFFADSSGLSNTRGYQIMQEPRDFWLYGSCWYKSLEDAKEAEGLCCVHHPGATIIHVREVVE